MAGYIVKNTTGRDVNLGDLRVKIPAGKSRDLLGRTSRICVEDIIESEKRGSLKRYFDKKILIRVNVIKVVEPPKIEMVDPSTIVFPRRRKSTIILDMGEIDDEVKDLVMDEDEEYLKQLNIESSVDINNEAPIITEEEEEKE